MIYYILCYCHYSMGMLTWRGHISKGLGRLPILGEAFLVYPPLGLETLGYTPISPPPPCYQSTCSHNPYSFLQGPSMPF